MGFQGILDAYLGKCPENFTYEGKNYTPKSFASSLGLNMDDYVTITSYTHHPFYSQFVVEVQDNWRNPASYNLPMDEMMQIIDNAVMNGYTVAWGGDVSEPGFTRDGLAYMIDAKKMQSLQGSDMARWLRSLCRQEKKPHRLARLQRARGAAHSGDAPGALRQLGAHRRPRYADLRYRQGPERQGVLHGEELLG